MILFVAMAKSGEDYLTRAAESYFKAKLRFEEISGWPCLITRYPQVTPEFVNRYAFRAIFISGFGYGWDEIDLPDLYGLYDVLHHTELPVLGACGGHQLIGHAFNEDFRQVQTLTDKPMRKLEPGEPDWNYEYHPGWFVETGMQPVQIVQHDPLFSGLPETIYVRQSHYCEVKQLPDNFILLATNDNCRLQAICHRDKRIYGVQFHPEVYTDYYPHGRQILQNFFTIAESQTIAEEQ